jgi:predicted amidohydrolase YtcJ
VSTRRGLLRLVTAGGAFAACRPGPSDLPSGTDRWHPYAGGLADLLIVGGTIWTMDPEHPEVGAVAARGGRVIAIGEPGDLTHLHGPRTRVLDLGGGLAVPGLTDAHAHIIGLGTELEEVDLRGVTSIEEAITRVRNAAPPTGWVLGRGWDQNLWPGAAMPTHDGLSAAFPDRPVWLRRVDGHAGWANLAALAAAGITADTPAPQGGEITLRDGPHGRELTGLLVDTAMELVPVPRPDRDSLRRRVLAAQARVLPLGLTGVHEMGVSQDSDATMRALATAGELKLRITAYADEDWFVRQLRHKLPEKPGHDTRYALVGVKLYVDGALGSRGAALLAPYDDRPGHRGALQHTAAQLTELVHTSTRGGWQVAAHAIGDRAIRELLDTLASLPPDRKSDPRLRVEHAQIVDLADIPRFARLGAIASMQPTHATSDMPWVPARIGNTRLPGAYAWRRFLAAGVPLALGSDFPVEQPNPTHGLHAAITRQDAHGQPPRGWLPDQRLSLWQAVAGFTTGAAFAAKQEHWRGRLSPGMAADLTCFRDDLRELPTPAIRDAPVRATVVGGRVAWE